MADPSSPVFEFAKEAWKIVQKGLEHEKTAKDLENAENELHPMFAGIEELARKIGLPAQEIESLKSIMTQMREALLNYSKMECWNRCLAPCYKEELDKADKSIKDFISYRLMVMTARTVMEIRYHQIGTGVQTSQIRQLTLKIDLETLILPEFIEGLNSPLMEALKSDLMKDDGDGVLNLTGFTGSGKTTLALQLCLDKQVQGWFNGNVVFKSVGSKIENNSGQQLASELREKWNDRKGLLVLDDVEPSSGDMVGQCWKKIPSDSKILVISRIALSGIGRPVAMEPLGKEDAITLLRYFVQPIGTASCNSPDHRVLLQVAECCGGFPMAIKMIGRDLRGKPDEFWKKYLSEWSQQGHSILDTHTKLLDHLHNSLKDSEEYKDISEFFMDLGLFPKHQIIAVSALLDMWAELYDHDDDGIYVKTFVARLTAMNLADRVLQMRVIGSSDAENHVDNQFLTQHNILRDLANRYSREQAGEFERKRLIIEINGNELHPECLRQQPLRGINAYLPLSKASTQQPVAARILSITTDQYVTPDLCYIQAAEAQVLVLNLRTHEYRLPEFIKEMKKLKVVIVTNYGLRSTQFEKFKLLGFPKALKRIRLQNVSVPCISKLKNLRKLSLYMCEMKTAFENSSMKFSKAMPNLVELKIEHSTDLVKLPAGLCYIVNLKKLSITKCRNFTEIPQEIRKLRNLELLRINYCGKFEEMPESISQLQSLTCLDISHCRTLRKLPDNIGKLQNLTNLYMSGCLDIEDLPNSVMDLAHLQRVICDDYITHKWEIVKASIQFDLVEKTATGMP